MRELLEQFPGAQRALFRKYHIGGCSSCGFSPDETLAGVCARNENLNVDEVIEHILASHAADRAMQIEPRELGRTTRAPAKRFTCSTFAPARNAKPSNCPGAHLFTQEFMQEILGQLVAHRSARDLRSPRHAQHGRGGLFSRHGFENVKSLRGGIDAWSAEVDPALPRYHLE